MVSYGIMTPPQNVSYTDLLRVWREADGIAEIEHAWLFDHLMPIGGDLDGPIFEGWTMLTALAAQTERIRLGIMVTSNRIRPPAILAKIAATVDAVSHGRLDFGIGAGSRPSVPMARREYDGSGLPYGGAAEAVARLGESLTVIRRLWTEEEPFDFHGSHVDLVGAFQNPKPVQRPGPPIVIGGQAAGVLRLVAAHADTWNIPGGDLDDALDRARLLDRFCHEIGRDPATITRSIALGVSFEEPEKTRNDIGDAVAAGFDHVVLILPGPYPDGIAHRVTEEFIGPGGHS